MSAAPEKSESVPAPLDGGRRRRRGGAEAPKVVIPAGASVEVPAGGRRKMMSRKQRAGVKKVAKALKMANKKAHRLAMTLKKKLRR